MGGIIMDYLMPVGRVEDLAGYVPGQFLPKEMLRRWYGYKA